MLANLVSLLISPWLIGTHGLAPLPLHVLIVGGGPDKTHNQVAIESNVRYVDRLLPANAPRRILFAGGDPNDANVQWQDVDKRLKYRKPDLKQLDGPSELSTVLKELVGLSHSAHEKPNEPILLYFTGHGSPNTRNNDNNHYDLWSGQKLDVRTLSTSLSTFPPQTPIALVMVQCFSGAFGNLLFEGGDPAGEFSDHHICGFFASIPQRPAAGCTPEINEAEYRDFTSYFFAALTGTDRMGRAVGGADYNHDGRVGMNEAYAYALIHDDSIDTPVCTSDVFLRHAIKTPDAQVFANNYSEVERWADPVQKVVLRELSTESHESGEARLADAYEAVRRASVDTENLDVVRKLRLIRMAKSVVLAHTLAEQGDRKLLARYRELIREEGGNPLKGN